MSFNSYITGSNKIYEKPEKSMSEIPGCEGRKVTMTNKEFILKKLSENTKELAKCLITPINLIKDGTGPIPGYVVGDGEICHSYDVALEHEIEWLNSNAANVLLKENPKEVSKNMKVTLKSLINRLEMNTNLLITHPENKDLLERKIEETKDQIVQCLLDNTDNVLLEQITIR